MDFEQSFIRVNGVEQGYVNDPKDPGGETKYGISKRSYPDEDIAQLTLDRAKFLYKRDFWDKLNADKLCESVAYQLFDFAINSGIETAIRYYQRALGVADDGHWGPVSQAAADSVQEHRQIMNLIAERQDYQTRLSNWAVFGKGWARRNARNLRYGAIDC